MKLIKPQPGIPYRTATLMGQLGVFFIGAAVLRMMFETTPGDMDFVIASVIGLVGVGCFAIGAIGGKP